MNESKRAAGSPQSTASLKRKATAASLGVLLGAFAVIAVSAQQNPNAAPTPVVSKPVAAASATSSNNGTLASINNSDSAAGSQAGSTSNPSTPVTTASHARTRQS